MRPRIAVDQPVDADLDAGTSSAVFEDVDPVSIDLRHLDAHEDIVAYGIRRVIG
jgi:hypothetical protein